MPTRQDVETVYTVEQAAQVLQMSPYWLREQLRAGRIAHYDLGRRKRIPASSLRVFLESRRVTG